MNFEEGWFFPYFDYQRASLSGINKTPISYYGGEQRMANLIVSLIPDHKLYCEPFVGGAAVFFVKEPSGVEVINDLNGHVVNFYRICQTHFKKLEKLVKSTPHSRQLHRETKETLKNPYNYSPLQVAWAFWAQTTMSFSAVIFGGYAYERYSNRVLKTFLHKKIAFTTDIRDRLKGFNIENKDAIEVIKHCDKQNSFFYCDPPYFNSDMGHYKGYTVRDFEELLKVLSNLNGMFLLSSYPSGILSQYTKKHRWHTLKKETRVAVTSQTDRVKTEELTANYPIYHGLNGLDTVIHVKARALKLQFELV